jgi:isoleucyl-tRNA synthetase
LRTVAGTGDDPAEIAVAQGRKCDRCWRVLTEVGTSKAHPTLCLRCTDAVEAA